ncbi:lysophospholipid acyltransferase family protein [Candidatus Nucleicultrix amoebiphila]|jgi:lysophospholipid acyltransferase (LPLAT)-like uncharacterized protein|uniref:lysophospholipid acyltransferase family protein n=1 Tax=Candidatus Nucleicultrix amoebiphila TaxID=1509244 RepID=UPI000A26F222|nr:lysophospholipid acyltransferase family protein [Candidatus Nucleicultrix amoebiphila]
MKQKLKQLVKKTWFLKFLCWVAARYIGFVYNTIQWKRIGFENIQPLWDSKEPIIVCFWHNRLMMTCFAWESEKPFHMLISAHPDGQLIAGTVAHYGIRTIAGSSSKGGAQALRSILKVLKNGHAIGITPDGPRGPRFKVAEGLLTIARLSGAKIIPVTFAVSRRKLLSSWDRLVLPFPFGKGVLMYGSPFTLPSHLNKNEMEEVRVNFERELTQLVHKADGMVGRDPVI